MKKFHVAYSQRAIRQLTKMDPPTRRMIKAWIDKNLHETENPRRHGKALRNDLAEYWRYRVGDYRIVVHIIDSDLIIVAISIAHRNEVYKRL